jgi:hypothetical protein
MQTRLLLPRLQTWGFALFGFSSRNQLRVGSRCCLACRADLLLAAQSSSLGLALFGGDSSANPELALHLLGIFTEEIVSLT